MKKSLLIGLLLWGILFPIQAAITIDLHQEAAGGTHYYPVVSYTANISYQGNRFSKWDRQVLSLRWAVTYGPEIIQQVENLTEFAFAPVDQPANGGDGYYYQMFVAPTASYAVSIAVGQTVDVMRIVLYSNLACVELELVTAPNAWVVTNSGEASVLHAVLGDEFEGFGNAVSTCATFPVEYVYVEAWPVDHTLIRLGWETTHEENNMGFAVERREPHEAFRQIGWIDPAGEAQGGAYKFDDLHAIPGVIYQYRLRQVDIDSFESWSRVVEATLAPATLSFQVYPNPSDGRIEVALYLEKSGLLTVECQDLQGRIVAGQELMGMLGQQVLIFDLYHLAAGLYVVRAMLEDEDLGAKKVVVE